MSVDTGQGAAAPALVAQFERLVCAPGGVARLRELILTLAVQGKLTRRDALAEPALALLARILKQKEHLIAAGKIKRDKPLLAIEDGDPPFDIPQSWCWMRLGGVTNYGSPTKGESIGPETWVLDLEDIEKSTGRLLHRVRRSERPSLSEKNSFQAGDVLYGKLRPYLNKVIVADEPGVCTTELVPFRCYGDWVPQYFKTALSSPPFLEYVNARSYGMKMPRLGTEDARSALLPLPPLEEQARIVARVDELMQLCDALEAKGRLEAQQHARLLETLLGTLTDSTTPVELAANWQRVAEHFDLLLDRPEAVDVLEQTVLQLAVRGLLVPQDPRDECAEDLVRVLDEMRREQTVSSGPQTKIVSSDDSADQGLFEPPPGWVWVYIDRLATVQGGIQKTPLRRPVRNHVPYLRVANVQRDALDLKEIERFEVSPEELERWQLNAGDLLIVEGNGSEHEIGRCAVWPGSIDPCVYQNHLIRVRCPHSTMTQFIQMFLNSPDGKAEMKRLAITTSGLFNLSVGKIRRYAVPVPPVAEQGRIVARVTELRRLCTDLRQRLAASRATQSRLAGALVESVVSA
jgi:type I restriction enzyme S subunit